MECGILNMWPGSDTFVLLGATGSPPNAPFSQRKDYILLSTSILLPPASARYWEPATVQDADSIRAQPTRRNDIAGKQPALAAKVQGFGGWGS